ncbi:MAG: hypothetical protein QGG83_06110, partial [Candidatus Woesearchaeota archaeon]|nr:hypothetical protein [Candidatus Woesearchaeota archaeon]
LASGSVITFENNDFTGCKTAIACEGPGNTVIMRNNKIRNGGGVSSVCGRQNTPTGGLITGMGVLDTPREMNVRFLDKQSGQPIVGVPVDVYEVVHNGPPVRTTHHSTSSDGSVKVSQTPSSLGSSFWFVPKSAGHTINPVNIQILGKTSHTQHLTKPVGVPFDTGKAVFTTYTKKDGKVVRLRAKLTYFLPDGQKVQVTANSQGVTTFTYKWNSQGEIINGKKLNSNMFRRSAATGQVKIEMPGYQTKTIGSGMWLGKISKINLNMKPTSAKPTPPPTPPPTPRPSPPPTPPPTPPPPPSPPPPPPPDPDAKKFLATIKVAASSRECEKTQCAELCSANHISCGNNCCGPGQKCSSGKCVIKDDCGGVMCPSGEECVNDKCTLGCGEKESRCGESCCNRGQECFQGSCLPKPCPVLKGERPTTACGGTCCGPNEYCEAERCKPMCDGTGGGTPVPPTPPRPTPSAQGND